MTDQVPEFASPQEALAHYGVKGMRWGVRNDDSGGGGRSSNPTRSAAKNLRTQARAETKADKAAIKQRGQSIGQARKETRQVGAQAHDIIREYRRATSPAAKAAAAKKYDTEIKQRVESPEFKAAYQKANTMSKGEMAVHVVLLGPFAGLTIPATRMTYSQMRKEGYELEVDMAHEILNEMKKG